MTANNKNKTVKTAAILLLAAMLLPCLVSCSKIPFLNREKAETQTYVNSDYHFSLTYPSSFFNIEEIPSEENGDEYRIEIRKSQTDKITIDITYKTEEGIRIGSLYDFAELRRLDKSRIRPLYMETFPKSVNSFSYDMRECPAGQKPAFYIYAATKRMLYTICYEFERGDKNADKVCETLKFEFDVYANVPKENAFLSDPLSLAGGAVSASIPADAELGLDTGMIIIPRMSADLENGVIAKPDYSVYRNLSAAAPEYCFRLSMPDKAEFMLPDLSSDGFDQKTAEVVERLIPGKVSGLSVMGTGKYNNNTSTFYRIVNFTCIYNGKTASGSLNAGYSLRGKYFEYVYLICDDASDACRCAYGDMLSSITF